MTFLPYYCSTFKTDHLLEPCKTNLARVKALKAAKKHIGPLEKCVECKGKMLKKRVEPNRSFEEGRLSTEQEALVIHPAIPRTVDGPPEEAFKPYQQDWGSAIESLPVGRTPPFISESAPVSEEAWQELGKKPPKKEEIAPELPKKQEKTVAAFKIIEKPLNWGLGEIVDAELRWCPTHPEVLQRVDKLGRWMGMCDECLSIRGKKCGEQNFEKGVTAPPVSIPLNMPKYAEIKEWLAAQAEEHERSLAQQIMFILKMAWRQGT